MTNLDYLRTLKAEELIDYNFINGGYGCNECPIWKECEAQNLNSDDEMIMGCSEFWLKWLKEERKCRNS